MAFAIDYESEARTSLAVTTVLLVPGLVDGGVRVGDLPPAWVWQRHGRISVEPAAAGRGRVARLTQLGRALRDDYRPRTDAIERRWRARFGAAAVEGVRSSAAEIAGTVDPGPPGHSAVELIAGWFPGGTVAGWPS